MNDIVGGRSGGERKGGSGGHRPRAQQDSSSSRPSVLGLSQKDSEKGRQRWSHRPGAVPGLWMWLSPCPARGGLDPPGERVSRTSPNHRHFGPLAELLTETDFLS